MAQTTTTISAAVTASDLIIPVTSATGFTAGNYLRIDNEFMVVVSVSGTNITVNLRGDLGSGAVAHNILAVADTGLSSDLADLPMGEDSQVDPSKETIVSYSAAGAIAIPTQTGEGSGRSADDLPQLRCEGQHGHLHGRLLRGHHVE